MSPEKEKKGLQYKPSRGTTDAPLEATVVPLMGQQ